ncbi:MAG: SAM-dependent methyltransferase [Chloroflexi bacterium HGW-Chloroflexi-4]|jgi:SAM-dependent methyltransferase|nr:MAG: SAM-dependent methyltransferase [Chloroflexi bacterium HGW-Chloroflexi-4]
MQTITDWAVLWRELVEVRCGNKSKGIETNGETDYWAVEARNYDQRVKSKWARLDVSRQFVFETIQPNSTIIDIGAGTGAWTIQFAKKMTKVTAVEPSSAMREVLLENIKEENSGNIEIVTDKWPQVKVPVHDYVFCSHAMYECDDFVKFVTRMMECARKMCFLLIRAPSPDGLITEACRHIWHQPHDSPNFTIAYNILLQMGINANVRFEESDRQHYIACESEESALHEIKERMGLLGTSENDDYLRDLLHRRLIKQDDQYIWPGSRRSALIYWTLN